MKFSAIVLSMLSLAIGWHTVFSKEPEAEVPAGNPFQKDEVDKAIDKAITALNLMPRVNVSRFPTKRLYPKIIACAVIRWLKNKICYGYGWASRTCLIQTTSSIGRISKTLCGDTPRDTCITMRPTFSGSTISLISPIFPLSMKIPSALEHF